jgi:EAL domain-containing protein (putative c-di-GMP-specific phosphodiesterase class I)
VDTAIEAVAFGATRYLQKPLSLDGLQQVALDALHRGQTAKLRRQALDRYEHEVLHERELGVKFARALETLYVEYQPIIRLSERRIAAYEALVRSREPALCTPHELLAAAEELDATFSVGRAVRRQVAALIRASGAERILVNLHAQDLNDDELFLPTSALSAVAAHVVLEITDRAALDCIEDIDSKLQKLRDLGFGIGLDGLGAGYAGLGSLVQLCPDVIKLDVSLIQDLDRQPVKRRLVQGMITLGKEIGVEVIAEGVETFAERDALRAMGCELYQGYLFAKPRRTLLPSGSLCGLDSRAWTAA